MCPLRKQKYRKNLEFLQFQDGFLFFRQLLRFLFDRRLLPDLLTD
jgi:hypothetical protein